MPPDKVVDVQALAGDSTDNVPGVPGIGVKTAAELINEYGDLETLLAARRRDQAAQAAREADRVRHAGAPLARARHAQGRRAASTVPVEQLGVREPEADALLGFLREMEFATLTKRIAEGLGAEAPPPVERPARAAIRAQPRRRRLRPRCAKLGGKPRPAAGATPQAARRGRRSAAQGQKIDRSQVRDRHRAAAARGLDRRGARRRPLRLRHRDDQPRSHAGRVRRLLAGGGAGQGLLRAARPSRRQRQPSTSATAHPKQVPVARGARPCCKPLLEDPSILKIGQNLKYDCLVLRRHGIELAPARRHHAAVLRARRRARPARHGRAGRAPSRAHLHLLHPGAASMRPAPRSPTRPSRRCRSTRRPNTPPRTPT